MIGRKVTTRGLKVNPELFESPSDRLTVLNKIEGLRVPREIEGRLLFASLFRAGLGRRLRVNIWRERESMEGGLFKK